MSKTNQERIQDNNDKIDIIQTKVDELPELPDLKYIYSAGNYGEKPIVPIYTNAIERIYYCLPDVVIVRYNEAIKSGIRWYDCTAIYKYTGEAWEKLGDTDVVMCNSYDIKESVLGEDNEFIYYEYYDGADRSSNYWKKYNKETGEITKIGQEWGGLSYVRMPVNLEGTLYVNNQDYTDNPAVYINNSSAGYRSTTAAAYLTGYKQYCYLFPTTQLVISTDKKKCCFIEQGDAPTTVRVTFSSFTPTFNIIGMSYERDLLFGDDGKVYLTNNALSTIEQVGTHNLQIEAGYMLYPLNDTYYIYRGTLYSFNKNTYTFSNIMSGVLELGDKFYSTTSNVIYSFEYTGAKIGHILEGETYYDNRIKYQLKSSEILQGASAFNQIGDPLLGNMPNNGILNYTPTITQQTIPLGYTTGGTINAVTSDIDNNIQAENIKKDVSILGTVGTYEGAMSQEDLDEATSIISNLFGGEN